MKKMNLVQRLLAVIIGIGMSLIGVVSPEVTLDAYAEERPTITELEVSVSDDGMGVSARCGYRNYRDQSGCEIILYLYKIDNESNSIVTSKMLAYADEGSESTDSIQVSEGIYIASVSINYGIDTRQINSRNYFRVSQVDGGYEVTEEGGTDAATADIYQASVTESSCEHDCEYIEEKQATPTEDAIKVYQCVKCGVILERIIVPNSAYATFLKETKNSIQNAQSGEVVVITDRWTSFNRDVLEAISSRSDVALAVHYMYEGKACEMIIPAGMNVSVLADENGFCGFRHMEEVISIMKNL